MPEQGRPHTAPPQAKTGPIRRGNLANGLQKIRRAQVFCRGPENSSSTGDCHGLAFYPSHRLVHHQGSSKHKVPQNDHHAALSITYGTFGGGLKIGGRDAPIEPPAPLPHHPKNSSSACSTLRLLGHHWATKGGAVHRPAR